MQSDKKNIDDLVRQKVDNASTDTGSMDADWQQMKQLLIPVTAVVAGKGLSTFLKGNIKLLSLVTAASGIALVTWLSNNNAPKDNNVKKVAENTASVNAILADTTKEEDTLILAKPAEKLNLFNSAEWIGDNTPSTDEVSDFIIDHSIDSVKSEKNLTEAEAQQVLNNFYDKIQKPDQEFVMDATKGGEITGNEGTKLTIPPMALVDENNNPVTGQVKIILQEYYKYSDMVAANLTTMSNGQQLASGGMVYIKAMQNDKQLQLKDYSPVALSMPTNKFDPQMQLFTSYTGENKMQALDTTFMNQDTVVYENRLNKDFNANNNTSISTRQINWTASYNDYRYQRRNDSIQFSSEIKIIDFQDNPYKVTDSRKRKAFYAIPFDCKISTQEVKKIMQEKNNGYYDKIFVKRKWRGKFTKDVVNDDHMIGDSTELYLQWALKWKYIDKKDSLFYINEIIKKNLGWWDKNGPGWTLRVNGLDYSRQYFSKLFIREDSRDSIYKSLVDSLNIIIKKKNDSLAIEYRKQDSIYFKEIYKNDSLVKDYKFSIKKLGWINCDRFSNYSNKTDYVIALPEKINTVGFTTNLVFTRVRSIMSGEISENKIRFTNIPVGEPVYLIGLGTKNGKVVSFIEKLKVSSSEAKLNSFSNITPEEFKNKIAKLDMD